MQPDFVSQRRSPLSLAEELDERFVQVRHGGLADPILGMDGASIVVIVTWG